MSMYDELSHNIAFLAACGFPWRDSFVLDPNVHCIKYLRMGSWKIGVDGKDTFRPDAWVILASFPSKKMLA
jgi:hypothetical protein